MKLWQFTRTITVTGPKDRLLQQHAGANDSVRGRCVHGALTFVEERTEPVEIEVPDEQVDPKVLWEMANEAFDRLSLAQQIEFEQLHFPSEDV